MGTTYDDVPVENVLSGAKGLEKVLVLGVDKEGNGRYASSYGGDCEKMSRDLVKEFFKEMGWKL